MDNNMIHIDDLVRQRLRGGEEPDRPGAWLTMRELLDKEMPVQAGYNWRRIIGYFTALLLLTTASVGGYHMYNNHLAGTQAASSGGGGGRDGVGAYGVPEGGLTANGVAATMGNTSNTAVSTEKTNTSASSSAAVASNGSTPSSNAPIDRDRDAANLAAPRASAHNGSSHSARASAMVAAPAQQAALTTYTPAVTTQNAVAANTPVSNNTPDAANADSRLYASSASATVRSHRTQKTPEHLPASGLNPLQAAAANVAVNLPRPATVTVKHDTIERLEIIARRMWNAEAGHHYYRIDTFPAGKIVVDRIVPSQHEIAVVEQPAKTKRHGLFSRRNAPMISSDNNSEAPLTRTSGTTQAPASGQMVLASAPAPVVPNAAPPATKTAEQQVGLAAAAIAASSVKSHQFRLWDAEKVEAAVNKFKMNLARIQMYPGIMGGINASVFTPNALGGFQLGLTSLFVLNDWWSVMTELKYIHRFNTGSSVRDDYMSVVSGTGTINTTTINGEQYKEYRWQDESVNHSFNYDVVRTFEMPLMLRYSWGRFYSQGGVNLVYSTAIQAKEVTQARGDYKWHTEYRPNTHDDEPFIKNDEPFVKITDFGTRFGTGYILSGGYMFSPAVYFDARVTQTFWDNSKTGGGKQISRDLLRTPSIQLSVGYRFNAKK